MGRALVTSTCIRDICLVLIGRGVGHAAIQRVEVRAVEKTIISTPLLPRVSPLVSGLLRLPRQPCDLQWVSCRVSLAVFTSKASPRSFSWTLNPFFLVPQNYGGCASVVFPFKNPGPLPPALSPQYLSRLQPPCPLLRPSNDRWIHPKHRSNKSQLMLTAISLVKLSCKPLRA